jgi:hypothetical protein
MTEDQTALQKIIDEEQKQAIIDDLSDLDKLLEKSEIDREEMDELTITIPFQPEDADIVIEELRE